MRGQQDRVRTKRNKAKHGQTNIVAGSRFRFSQDWKIDEKEVRTHIYCILRLESLHIEFLFYYKHDYIKCDQPDTKQPNS